VNATEITVIGNVVNSPQRVRLQNGSVTNFRLASTERRFDRERQEYVDGGTFWSDVECYGDLGGYVSHSVSKGDPVVVVGTLTTRQWENENGRGSVSKIRAEAVGHNLARGTADLKKPLRAPAAAPESSAPLAGIAPSDQLDAPESLVAGRDYEADPATLHMANSDDADLAPALH
jgi:single-strand DNA-binding protein